MARKVLEFAPALNPSPVSKRDRTIAFGAGTIVQRVKFPPHFNVPPHTHSSSCTLRLPLPHVLPFESVCTLRCLRQTLYHPRSFQSWLRSQWI